MRRVTECLLVAIGACVLAQQVGGDAPQPPPHPQVVTCSIQIVDHQNRVRAELGVGEPPNDYVALRLFDVKGKEKLVLRQAGEEGAQLSIHNASGRPYLQLLDVHDADLKVSGGILRMGGEFDGASVECHIQANKMRFSANNDIVLTVPERPKGK